MLNFRLPLENGKYTYLQAKAVFQNGEVVIHLIDRLKPKASVSIVNTIDELQPVILEKLGIGGNVLAFLKDSKWVLYGKEGDIFLYTFGEKEEITPFHTLVDEEMAMEVFKRKPSLEKVGQLSMF